MRDRCFRSADGAHEFVKGTVADFCRYCWIIPRYHGEDDEERVLYTVPRKKVYDVSAGPLRSSKRIVNPPKGPGRLNKIVALIERDGLKCFYCEHDLVDPESAAYESLWFPTLDHLLPRSLGGNNDLANLVLACRTCNTRKGDHVLFLAEVIVRSRRQLQEAHEQHERDLGFIDHLQWELFDAGIGEIPGRTQLTKGHHWKRPKPRVFDDALLCELDQRTLANFRAENSGGPHGRTAAVIKRGRLLVRREAVLR